MTYRAHAAVTFAIVAALALTSCTVASESPSSSPSGAPSSSAAIDSSTPISTVLLTDDDGWDAEGITVMYDALVAAGYTVTLVAPHTNYSGASMSAIGGTLTAGQDAADPRKWWVDGTPVDSVRLGLTGVLATAPDVVISGVNHGANAAFNVNYSGTVGAATAAAEQGVPAIAVSADVGADDSLTNFAGAAQTVLDLLERLDDQALASMAEGRIINVNVPVGDSKGVRVAPQANVEWVTQHYSNAGDGSWTTEFSDAGTGGDDTDKALIAAGFTTVTVLAASRDGSLQKHPELDSVLHSIEN